ncbi:MAG: four-helix bundle copper-binding protein [Chloroflexi bacterium]|nr:four-helix bundle copper-binding protein [Chloroflexota bacterium]
MERLSGACAELCERTAQACDQFGGDRQMQNCAEACRACADACRKMSKMAA